MSAVRIRGRLSDRHAVKVQLRRAGLHTVCEEARCPNMAECFGAKTATFLILGNVCTRRCRFCAVAKNRPPESPDSDEPRRVASAVLELGIRHAVITSVTRDDLEDGGSSVFVQCLQELRRRCPGTTVEVLVPDFAGQEAALHSVLEERPEVFNHNIETVPRLYPIVRPQADFRRSLQILSKAAARGGMLVKSGMMVGLGETQDEVIEVLRQLKNAGCLAVTLGQYLRPNKESLEVARMVTEEEFAALRSAALEIGIQQVWAGPLVRSSYRAREVVLDQHPRIPNAAVSGHGSDQAEGS